MATELQLALPAVVAFGLQLALASAAALLAPRAKASAVVLGVLGFVGAPWLAGSIPILRGLTALLGGVALLRIIDLVRSKERWTARRRLLHVLTFVDSRTVRPAPRHLDLRALGRALAWGAVAAAGMTFAPSASHVVRWAGGVVFVYCAIEAGYDLFGAAYRALGFVTPPLHVLPIASLSVAELWGARWARPISAWLRETCFRPLVRRGRPKTGLVLAFLASALGHAYPIFVATGATLAAAMFAFFVAQAVFVVAEALLGASRWSHPVRRTWTVVLMLASSPLFVEPALRVVGV